MKHLKRRNTRKKKRDVSTKKKEKEKGEQKKKEKKKKHQPSLSTKIDRNVEPGRAKKASIQEMNEKKSKKKKMRKGSESTSKMMKKRKKEAKGSKNLEEKQNLFVSGEVFMNSLYTEKAEQPEKTKKKKKKLKGTVKSKEGKKGKMFKLGKKTKESPKEMTSKERKRYLSVNAGKSPLLESDLMQNFNPRKTLNPKSISLKRGNSFKSNDIQKTDLFTYKFQRDSLKKNLKEATDSKKTDTKKQGKLYGNEDQKGVQTALYQRNKSQVSSDNDEASQGLYKNLYSGRHEKNILEYNSNQSRKGASLIKKKTSN